MNPAELIDAVASAGGHITLSPDGQRVHCRLPRNVESMLEQVRHHRAEILQILKVRSGDVDHDLSGAAHNEETEPSPELIRRWLSYRCVPSWRCSTQTRFLYRDFCSQFDFVVASCEEGVFLNQLETMGFSPDEVGMVSGLALNSDFRTALEYERTRQGLSRQQHQNLKTGENEMPLIIKNKQKEYQPPDEGEHTAVLADVVDLGIQDTQYGKKEQVRIIWLVAQRDSEGKHIRVSQRFNSSLHPKSRLCQLIETLTGHPPGRECDIEKLIGRNARLFIKQTVRDGRTCANVSSIVRPRTGSPSLAIPPDFIRVKDRNNGDGGPSGGVATKPSGNGGGGNQNGSAPSVHGLDITDDDVSLPDDDAETRFP